MSEIATLKRMAASDEYSATETAIFDGAVNELWNAHQEIARLRTLFRVNMLYIGASHADIDAALYPAQGGT